jgi:hypothetical protein
VHCNFLQGIEGGIDTAHSSFLHNEDIKNTLQVRSLDTHPDLDVEITSYGFMYAGIRHISPTEDYLRVYQFVMPNQQMRANLVDVEGKPRSRPGLDGHIWVPMDDDSTMLYTMKYGANDAVPISDDEWWHDEDRAGRGAHHLIPGTYWTIRNSSNDFLIDRELQRTKTFTGIYGIGTQDQALVEGMEGGGIVRRELEALGSTDRAIQTCRSLLLEAMNAVSSGLPLRGTDPVDSRHIRATELIADRSMEWLDSAKEGLVAEW